MMKTTKPLIIGLTALISACNPIKEYKECDTVYSTFKVKQTTLWEIYMQEDIPIKDRSSELWQWYIQESSYRTQNSYNNNYWAVPDLDKDGNAG